ncbi:MAG: DUF885 domain-containing protein [Vicinamibacteria bacterium]|nr:DUF885 domain-containing protein [Vicinamibacteria bacterium]
MNSQEPSPSQDVTHWLDRFFEHYHRSNPVSATFIGEHRFDPWLPDYSEAAVDDAKARIATLLAESSGLALDALSVDEKHDVRLAQGALRIQEWELGGRHFHRGNPSLYTGEAVFGLISLFLTDYAPLRDRLGPAAERLAAIPRLLDQAKENLDASPRAWTERAIRECEGTLTLLDEGLPKFADGAAVDFAPLALSAARARKAVEEFQVWLENDLLDRARDEVAVGEEALALHLSEGHFLQEDAAQIERYARAELAEATAALAERAKEFGADSPSAALAQLKAHRPSAHEYEARYARFWEDARTAAAEKGLLTWPDFPIRYVERPAWVRAAAPYLYFLFYRSPAASRRPAVHDYLIAPFDPTQPVDAQQAFLEAHNDSVIRLNHVIHHGGIGHHVQNFHAFRSGSRIGRMAAVDCASRIALLCGGTMAEGWACYATDLMSEAGFLTPLERYAELQGRARMCVRAIVDVRLHEGRWTLEHAARFYEEHALMPSAAAMGEAVKNSMFPGAAVMYLMGRDAIHRLREDMLAMEGRRFSLGRFHDTFLSHGSIPVSLVATAMKEAAASRRV